MRIELDTPSRSDVRQLLNEHLLDMLAISPVESVHALDGAGLAAPSITFWTVRDGHTLLGCGALRELKRGEGEIKSMRTAAAARRRGIATRMLTHILDVARQRGYERVSLETGSHEFFAPARLLYSNHGFTECPPFADYRPDPNSVFMTLELSTTPDVRS
jgi:putative acetyltransferase